MQSVSELPKQTKLRQESNKKTSSLIQNRKTMILIANYRDSMRCAETVDSLFTNAVEPDLLTIGIYDHIYANETNCIETYCAKVGPNCRRDQMRNDSIDASLAKGPTVRSPRSRSGSRRLGSATTSPSRRRILCSRRRLVLF